MRKSIVAAVIGMLAAGVTYVNAQTNTTAFWDQNANFILVSQSSGGRAALSTKVLIADLIGASITNAGDTIVTNIVTGVTDTNLLPGTNFPASFTNTIISGTNTNTVILTQTSTSPFTYAFTNGITTTNGAGFVFPAVAVAGKVTATVTSTNASGVPVYTLDGGTTTNAGGGVVTVTNTAFAKTAKLIVRQPSPSGDNLTSQDQFLVVEAAGKNARIVADVTPFFKETFGTLVHSITPNKHFLDFTLTFTGKTITFESRGSATITTGTAKGGTSQRKVFNSTLVGSGEGNGSPIVVSGKFNLTGGQINQGQ